MSPPAEPAPGLLRGPAVTLEPLAPHHAPALAAVAAAGELWRHPHIHIPAPEGVQAYVQLALAQQARGIDRPYAIVRHGRVVGSTRFQFILPRHRRLQIGSTWLALDARRQGVSRESKWLMLREAFEAMGMLRVEFMAHPDNLVSRRSLEGLGAQFEGVLRRHVVVDGASRDSAIYSITVDDWPQVAARLAPREPADAAA